MSYYRQMKFADRHTVEAMKAVGIAAKSLTEARATVDCPMKHRTRIREWVLSCVVMLGQLNEMHEEIANHLGKEKE